MYTALIIDDETDARSVMRKSLELFCPQFTDIREAKDRAEALTHLKHSKVDMTFLDIRLKQESGIALYPELSAYCPNIVFVTAYNKYAVTAFKMKALHYLLKPVDPDDLVEAVDRADLAQSRIVVATVGARTPLRYDEIVYLKSDGPYVYFYTADGQSLLASHGLKYYDSRIQSGLFCRPHQSYLVNLTRVERIDLEAEQFGVVYLKGIPEPIPMSKRRRSSFVDALNALR